jgi:multicomponent K+:H+ antiporter subunit F
MIVVAGTIASAALTIALVLCGWRLWRGPTAADRILALDTMYVTTVALLVLLGIVRDSTLFFEAALVMALMGFVGTVALAKFVLRRDITE